MKSSEYSLYNRWFKVPVCYFNKIHMISSVRIFIFKTGGEKYEEIAL